MSLKRNLGENYAPTLFLSALGNGGLSVSFYVYLHFMVKHMPQTFARGAETVTTKIPLATFDAVKAAFTGGSGLNKVGIAVALLGILVFAVRHYAFLIWNLREYAAYKHTEACAALHRSNKEISLAAIPLTLSMSINVMFVLAAVFVPGIWNIVEFMFPAAMLGFLLVGIYALRIFVNFMSRVLTSGDFDCAENNSLSQMVAVFAFAMVAVGFAAPGAMSNNLVTSAVAITGSMFFLAAAVLIGLQSLFLGFRAMLQHGVSKENSPTLWIVIPIVTLIGITIVRIDHGLHMNLEAHSQPGQMFVTLVFLLALQVLFGILGWYVMKAVGYFQEFVHGDGKSPVSLALICPGVALFVFGLFVLHMGFVRVGVVAKFSVTYYVLLALLAYVQVRTIALIFKLERKLMFD